MKFKIGNLYKFKDDKMVLLKTGLKPKYIRPNIGDILLCINNPTMVFETVTYKNFVEVLYNGERLYLPSENQDSKFFEKL
jgi:hypothetical protein